MSTDRNYIDNLLQDKFLSFEGEIPVSDWSAIEKRLNKKKKIIWFWWAAIPLLIISGMGSYLVFRTDFNSKTINNTKNSNSVRDFKSSEYTEKDNNKNGEVSIPNTESKDNDFPDETKRDNVNPKAQPIVITDSEEIIPFPNTTLPFEPIGKEVPYLFHGQNYVETQSVQSWGLELNIPKPIYNAPNPLLSYEFGLNFSPAFGLDNLKANKDKTNFINRAYFDAISGSSSLGSGFNNGVHAQMNIGKNWFIRQGIYSTGYSVNHSYDFMITHSWLYVKDVGLKDYLPIAPQNQEHVKHSGKTTIQYIALPLVVGNRTYFNTKTGIESKIGVTFSRLWKASGKTINPTFLTLEPVDSNNTIKKWNSGLTISTGIFFKTKNNFIFTVEPSFSTVLGSAHSKDYPLKTRYYNYGINLNINYILKRNTR